MPSFKGIFHWSEWDEFCEFEMFYDCELLRKVGEYEEGSEFEIIYFHKAKMRLEFYLSDGDSAPAMVKNFILED